ncbi:hypothetical protein TNCV_1746841 [Trichonephila clavipes]|nr:hypothetical protein TNCV_1746841 [Trichonephila clavipes]
MYFQWTPSHIGLYGNEMAVLLAYFFSCVTRRGNPSLNPDEEMTNDYVLLNKWVTRNFEVQRGDIVALTDEGSHAGEKKQYLNASASNFQMFPSTSSTFCPSEKSTYVLMDNDMWSSFLWNIKCDMCSLDVECNGAYGFSTKIELKEEAFARFLLPSIFQSLSMGCP